MPMYIDLKLINSGLNFLLKKKKNHCEITIYKYRFTDEE